jgi:hypothetical protein
MSLRWCSIAVDADQELIFGPRTGHLYLASPSAVPLQRLVGLRDADRVDALADPVGDLAFERCDLADEAGPVPSRPLRMLYLLCRASRGWVPAVYALRVLGAAAAARRASRPLSVEEIARTVHRVERSVRVEDCYPRALLTYWLCRRNGLPCRFVIGVLAPTRMMHAWCSTDGVLPYEPYRTHHAFQPLLVV